MKIVIPGRPITKKNSQRILRGRNGKPRIAQSEKYLAYEEEAGKFIRRPARPIEKKVNVKCVYYMPTRHRVDLTNLLGATCDILVKYKVLKDDCCTIAASHDGSRVLYDKKNPRVEVTITEVQDDQ